MHSRPVGKFPLTLLWEHFQKQALSLPLEAFVCRLETELPLPSHQQPEGEVNPQVRAELLEFWGI